MQHNKNPMWRDVKLAGDVQPLWWRLGGHPSADCLLGNEAVMFLTVMERLSSRWQQDMSVGMTHIQRHKEAASTESASGSDTQSSEQKISRLRDEAQGYWAMSTGFHLGQSAAAEQ